MAKNKEETVGEEVLEPEAHEAAAEPEAAAGPSQEDAAAEESVAEAEVEIEAPPEGPPAVPAPRAKARTKAETAPKAKAEPKPKPRAKAVLKVEAEPKAAKKPARKAAERKKIVRLPKPEGERGRRKERRGVVVSNAMDKTIVVRVDTAAPHPRYKKIVRRSTKFHAHDEGNLAKPGDFVRIVETRPLSATKRWRLAEVLEEAK